MRQIPRELLSRWHVALSDVLQLEPALAASDPRATERGFGHGVERHVGAHAHPSRTRTVRGPLTSFSEFLESTNALERFLGFENQADPAVARARSTGAFADFEAARCALDLAMASGHHPRHLIAMRREPRLDAGDVTRLVASLSGTRDIRDIHERPHERPRAATDVVDWRAAVRSELETVTADAARRLAWLDGSVLGDQAEHGIRASLTTLLDDDVLGKLIDASAHAIAFLHRMALELAHAGLRKIAGLCDDGVRKSLDEWFTRRTPESASAVVAHCSGADLALDSWELWAGAGEDVAAHLGAAAISREEHLQHLAWAQRAGATAGFVFAASRAAPPTVPFAVFFGGIALVGIAAWMLWCADHHCSEVARLV